MRLSNFWVPVMESARLAIETSSGDAALVATELKTALDTAATCTQNDGFSAEDTRLALFAVVAWIDELAMSHPWAGADDWRRSPLQRDYFGTTKAGVAFFEKLEALPEDATEIREIYALAMLKGFHGRYAHRPATELMDYRRALLVRVTSERQITDLSIEQSLFPAADRRHPPASVIRTATPSLAALLVILLPVCLLLVLYLFLDYRLAHTVAQLVAPLTGRL